MCGFEKFRVKMGVGTVTNFIHNFNRYFPLGSKSELHTLYLKKTISELSFR